MLDFGLAIGLLRLEGGLDTTKIYSHDAFIGGMANAMRDEEGQPLVEEEEEDISSEEEEEEEEDKVVPEEVRPQSSSSAAAVPLLPLTLFGNPLNPDHRRTLDRLRQFRGNSRVRGGTIDVYWLYDDGGLTILLPHLLR